MSSAANKTIHAGPEDGWHGVVSPDGPFQPEPGRYHLYIGLFCPFAHRAYLVRHLKGLQHAIGVSVVKPYPKGNDQGWPGWQFPGANGPDDTYDGATADKLFGSKFMHEVYFKADPDYKGRYSVPVLWDTKTGTIVNNESHELLRWMPTAFNSILPEGESREGAGSRDLNTGVYKAGFAHTQRDYDKNVPTVFAALNHLESTIHKNAGLFILGKEMTELDLRAFATIIRFDAIYVQHFKCNLGTIRGNYPVIHNWMKNLYWNVPGFKETTDFKHIKENYTKSHADINPLAITPLGPFPDVEADSNLGFASMQPGSISHPVVLERQKELYK
ncbi:glutathione S-transferase [Apiospora kogelbergensis]|uniref:glutathione S-transferase n=1 Tax=Apiospora kogelbergensis TaxID=1337665 RepID=UPI00312EA8B7